jgi:hydroxymethylbilane synthase
MRFKDLPPNAVIATGSLRRTCQILHARPDLHIVDLRGNIHTRIKKLDESAWSGIVLAKAGIARLGVEERIAEVLPLDLLLPAVGQGAVALEIRATDDIVRPYVDAIHSHDTAVAVNAERAVLRTLEGGCQVPLGALARAQGTMLHLDAIIGSIDGTRIIKASQVGTTADPERLGVSVAEELLLNGGNEILHEIRNGRAGT